MGQVVEGVAGVDNKFGSGFLKLKLPGRHPMVVFGDAERVKSPECSRVVKPEIKGGNH